MTDNNNTDTSNLTLLCSNFNASSQVASVDNISISEISESVSSLDSSELSSQSYGLKYRLAIPHKSNRTSWVWEHGIELESCKNGKRHWLCKIC